MQIGIAFPYHQQYADYRTVINVATQADAMGFDTVWFAEGGDGWHPIGLFGSLAKEPLAREGRPLLSGSPDEVVGDLRWLERLGLTSSLFCFSTKNGAPESVLEQMELCARAMLPKLR